MSPARLNALVFAACSVLAVVLAWRASQTPPAPPTRARQSPLSAIPQGAMLVATLDAKKLRSTSLGASLVAEGDYLPGLGPMATICGFDPILEIGMLAFALPGLEQGADEQATIEFGLAAYGDFSGKLVASCAASAISRRGGSPVATKVGSFLSMRQRHGSAGEIAARDGGPVLVGAGRYLREMIDAADGRVPSASTDERHRALRTSLGEDGMLLVTWLLPRGWFEQLVESNFARLSPLAAVQQAALRVDIREVRSLATLALGCENPAACSELAEVAKSLVDSELEPWLKHRVPDAERRFAVNVTPGQVRLTLWFYETEAIQLIGRALDSLRREQPSPNSSAEEPASTPDEALPPPASSR